MAFEGWPAEALAFYEGLGADNTKAYWEAHRAIYERCVKGPMEALLAELEDDFGSGRMFRPYRDIRFSHDKRPYKLSCSAHVRGAFISLSADGLFVGSGLYMPEPDRLERYRDAVAAPASGAALESIVAALSADGYTVGSHESLRTAPRGYAKDHPRIGLLRQKGIAMSRSWPPGPWLATAAPKDRVIACLQAAAPLNAWIERYVG